MGAVSISVITVSSNAANLLPSLISSLKSQTDKDFEWIVVDGASTDGTVDVIKSSTDITTTWISEPDFGIYDAMNKALHMAKGDYYLVLGADDVLYPNAIEQYKIAVNQTSADIVSAKVRSGNRVLLPGHGKPFIHGHLAYVSQHSVGSLIKKDLHEHFGYYSRRFPIAADQFFIKKVCGDSRVKLKYADFVAGYYPRTGTSGTDIVGSMTEFYRVQLETEHSPIIQTILFVLRLVLHLPKIIKFTRLRAGK